MPFEIKKPFTPKKTFIINRNLHLNAAGKWVEETDPTGVRNLGSKGKALYEEEAKSYGLDESHRLVEEKAEEKAEEKPEAHAAEILNQAEAREAVGYKAEEEKPAEPEKVEHEELKGKLPADFPGHAALADADPPINTYGQLRKAIARGTLEKPWYADIANIADKTAEKIEERLAAIPEDAE